jgi:hypothetical protein
MHWGLKMQTEIALSSTEAEFIALSLSMREVIPIMWLLQEAYQNGVPVLTPPPKIQEHQFLSCRNQGMDS